MAIVEKLENISRSILTIRCGETRGNGIAVSSRDAFTAFHAEVPLGTEIEIVLASGDAVPGTVIFCTYEENLKDIAVIRLNNSGDEFTEFVPVLQSRIYFTQQIYVVGHVRGVGGHNDALYIAESSIHTIENDPDSALCRANYYCEDGLSGAGIVTHVRGSDIFVVGVHVGSHDTSVAPPKIKKIKKSQSADADSVSDSASSIAGSLHGHTAYSLICVASRVPGLLNVLDVPPLH
jgi:hypothetical protein